MIEHRYFASFTVALSTRNDSIQYMMASHIGFFIPKLSMGGAEKTVVKLSKGFVERGYQVELILANADGELLDTVHKDVKIVDLHCPSVPFVGVLSAVPALTKYLNNNDLDVVISFMGHANIACIISSELSNSSSALIVSERNAIGDANPSARFVVKYLKKALYNRDSVNTVVPNSSEIARDINNILGVSEEKITTIYNPAVTSGLKEESEEPVQHSWFNDESPPVILGVGSLRKQKRFDVLLRAFARIVQTESAHLVIIGEGTMRSNLEQLAHELNIQENVQFLGQKPNPYKYMRGASVFVLSSAWEGQPNVLIEALACGCPAVATDSPGGSAEILEDGKHGPLVPVDDPKRLAQAIRFILEHPPDQDILEERAKRFTQENAVDEFESLMSDIVSSMEANL